MESLSIYVYDFFEKYLSEVRGLAIETTNTYKYDFMKLLYFFKKCKNIKSDKITINMLDLKTLEEYIAWMSSQKLSGKTINKKMIIVIEFLEYVSNRNPKYIKFYTDAKKIKKHKETKKIIKWLSNEEIEIIFGLLDYRNKKDLKKLAMLSLMYECAIRVNSLINIKSEDIDFEKCEIKIILKGGGTGLVPATPELLKLLKLYINTYSIQKQEYLFTYRGTKITRQTVNKMLVFLIKKAKEKNNDLFNFSVSPHTFRHSRAMHLLNNEKAPVPLTTVQKLLIHKNISSTEIYAEASPETVRKAVFQNANEYKIKRKYNKQKEQKLEDWLKNSLKH